MVLKNQGNARKCSSECERQKKMELTTSFQNLATKESQVPGNEIQLEKSRNLTDYQRKNDLYAYHCVYICSHTSVYFEKHKNIDTEGKYMTVVIEIL